MWPWSLILVYVVLILLILVTPFIDIRPGDNQDPEKQIEEKEPEN